MWLLLGILWRGRRVGLFVQLARVLHGIIVVIGRGRLTIAVSGIIWICSFPLSLDSGERFFAVLLVLGVGFTPDSMRSGVEGSVDGLHCGGADT